MVEELFATKSSRFFAFLQLFRAPNVFTAIADVLMGFLFVVGLPQPVGVLVVLIATSCLLYTSGMVLNDVFDFDVDAKERPYRPLPSGRISLSTAKRVGYAMLVSGVLLGWCASILQGDFSAPWRSGAIATVLAIFVVLYNVWAKRTAFGPIFMGACRFFNVLLGMSITTESFYGHLFAGYSGAQVIVAAGIGVYIVGVTWFARTEADEKSSAASLLAGVVVMTVGIALLAVFPRLSSSPPLQIVGRLFGDMSAENVWVILLAMLAFPVIARCLTAAADPTPHRMQMAVRRCILSLIVFDAAITFVAAGPFWGIVVLSLLVPTMILGAWVYST